MTYVYIARRSAPILRVYVAAPIADQMIAWHRDPAGMDYVAIEDADRPGRVVRVQRTEILNMWIGDR